MIKFITTGETLAIRNEVLREGKLAPAQCIFPGDDGEGAFHLGYFHEGVLACIATFHKQDLTPGNRVKIHEGAVGYQVRGMATLPEFRGQGFGNKVVNFAIVYLRGQKVNYIWGNARKIALPFYKALGFEFISDEFEILGIGPHKVMYLKVK
ncbi:GNAT family N-acetyltransferase [Hufsiella ginkgonis]|uniref:GNAT family N-acetyltransferase n=1 Tax=Hufsiella ginkgonis TaxID=2695274 RepID=A0A7K1XSB9_9SPHI|nr:GNAT family N-acetyltransferase [Hufsiella ginkgonis]MXV13854.1 GNAT family N-acetyltransferase [Hufsiella ginkgonis]